MKSILNFILEFIAIISYKWILAIKPIWCRLVLAIKDICKRRKMLHGDRNATNGGCGRLDHPSFHRPDPLIYSQKYLASIGLPITWNNPDIVLLRNGLVVTEHNLLPNTEYEIDATIWNNSFDAPAFGLKVDFSFLSFGAGTTVNPIGSDIINVGVKGGSNHPSHAKIKWLTPAAGHYCLQVQFQCQGDLNSLNNLGQNNVNVQPANSPANFTFEVRNTLKKSDLFQFEIDTYTIPQSVHCSTRKGDSTPAEKWREVRSKHNLQNYAIPSGWTVNINPATFILQPEESANIQVSIEPPADFSGQKSFNVNTITKSGHRLGGVTLIVSKS